MKKTKSIIITSGGTSEPIDEIRRITNVGRGTLGSKIADCIYEKSNDCNIIYIHSKGAVMPKNKNIKCIEITSCNDLQSAIFSTRNLCEVHGFIHSMAVSDYTIESAVKLSDIAKRAENGYYTDMNVDLRLYDNLINHTESKISSQINHLCLVLKQTPKIISNLRNLFPNAKIIGFKLLDNVEHNELIKVAYELLQKNKLDYVLANDFSDIKSGKHKGYLIDKNRHKTTCGSKDEIAKTIADAIILNN